MFTYRAPRFVAAFALALVTALSTSLNAPAATAASSSRADWLGLAATLFTPLQPLLRAVEAEPAVGTGTDGRLTVLLLGSDTRSTGVGLTDTIMVVSVKGNTINAASIPRDTARIPNPFTASTTDVFKGRVNAILKKLRAASGSVQEALNKFEIVIERLLQIEIDYNALITFKGFDALVDEVEPVPITIGKSVRDPKFWDDPNKQKGVYFPQASGYHLYRWQPSGSLLCNGNWRNYSNPPSSTWCRRALPFVRSRKGKGNSDFVRARRQQDFVGATIKRVVGRGSGAALTALLNKVAGQKGASELHTNIPLTASNALDLYNRLKGASLYKQVVFSPKTYASRIKGTSSYQLKLTAVRAWTAAYLK